MESVTPRAMADEHINPYASPQNLDAVAAASHSGASAYLRPYLSARGKAKWAVGAASVAIVLHIVLLGSCFLQLSVLHSAQTDAGLGQETADWNDARQLAISVATAIAEVTAFITLLVWIYATHANLPA